MLHIVGLKARPIGLNFFLWILMGGRGVLQAKKIEIFFVSTKNFFNIFFPNIFFHGQNGALQLVNI